MVAYAFEIDRNVLLSRRRSIRSWVAEVDTRDAKRNKVEKVMEAWREEEVEDSKGEEGNAQSGKQEEERRSGQLENGIIKKGIEVVEEKEKEKERTKREKRTTPSDGTPAPSQRVLSSLYASSNSQNDLLTRLSTMTAPSIPTPPSRAAPSQNTSLVDAKNCSDILLLQVRQYASEKLGMPIFNISAVCMDDDGHLVSSASNTSGIVYIAPPYNTTAVQSVGGTAIAVQVSIGSTKDVVTMKMSLSSLHIRLNSDGYSVSISPGPSAIAVTSVLLTVTIKNKQGYDSTETPSQVLSGIINTLYSNGINVTGAVMGAYYTDSSYLPSRCSNPHLMSYCGAKAVGAIIGVAFGSIFTFFILLVFLIRRYPFLLLYLLPCGERLRGRMHGQGSEFNSQGSFENSISNSISNSDSNSDSNRNDNNNHNNNSANDHGRINISNGQNGNQNATDAGEQHSYILATEESILPKVSYFVKKCSLFVREIIFSASSLVIWMKTKKRNGNNNNTNYFPSLLLRRQVQGDGQNNLHEKYSNNSNQMVSHVYNNHVEISNQRYNQNNNNSSLSNHYAPQNAPYFGHTNSQNYNPSNVNDDNYIHYQQHLITTLNNHNFFDYSNSNNNNVNNDHIATIVNDRDIRVASKQHPSCNVFNILNSSSSTNRLLNYPHYIGDANEAKEEVIWKDPQPLKAGDLMKPPDLTTQEVTPHDSSESKNEVTPTTSARTANLNPNLMAWLADLWARQSRVRPVYDPGAYAFSDPLSFPSKTPSDENLDE
eukprot:CAMPEP_0175078468 /NCGR_PEP_ID=MMETSP0052_2-20121109/24139_1 /TAXON_ID=51329 ORGANISM="Polytomella parva, Strain SAG 63-3" /NCGR_SAMPLE_ID=MMETSP0052_2 /ASSEMBLY_ACC=CAM_ASM_000194 /LENGTH=766 /DNA_ID=CAMNT_0016348401 /DNA_START=306 /DNA_END=2606 /DNA_ORIENTATION=-